MWFKQTINNACGLYSILHAVCNGEARKYIRKSNVLNSHFRACGPSNFVHILWHQTTIRAIDDKKYTNCR
jgi:hypothetical protein